MFLMHSTETFEVDNKTMQAMSNAQRNHDRQLPDIITYPHPVHAHMSTATPLDALAFPLSGTRLIEASAGTGKTYTIAALYIRLILGHGLPADLPVLLPPDILVVTFTEAATKELRERIRARLIQAATFFRQTAHDEDAFLSRLRQTFAPEQWPGCAYRLEQAANWMDEAAIYTIHGWCNRMLQQHAFESGSLFRQEVDNDDQSLLQQVVYDYWRQFFYPLSETACQAVYKLAASPEQLAKILYPLLFETDASGLEGADIDINLAIQSWENWELRRSELETQARELWLAQSINLTSLLQESSDNGCLHGNLYRKAGFGDKLANLHTWAAHGDYLALDALAKFGRQKLQAGLVTKHADKKPLFEQAAFQAIDVLVAHTEQETDIGRMMTLHALHWIKQHYGEEKQRVARLTFSDMITRLDLALQGQNAERLSLSIRKQYPLALIDEFQDTDAVQYRIFARLYPAEINGHTGCFMIGDPKQAIYSFRGGDIYTYLQAHQATLGRHYTLDTNFRSTQALVSAVNQLFLYAETRQPDGVFGFKTNHSNPLPFIPVNARGRDKSWLVDNQCVPAMTLWHLATDSAIGMPEYRQRMADATASEIVRLLRSADLERTGFADANGSITALQPADIAILVRSGSEAKIMRRALATRQLRSVYLSERELITASREAADMLIWLKALAEPTDERKVRAALSTATLGWDYQALQHLVWNEAAWESHLERFIGYRQRWQQDGILPTLRQFIHDYALSTRLLADDAKAFDGERCLTNLLHLAELLQHASSRLEGEHALIRYLAEAINNGQMHAAAAENVIRLESDANLIKIITIHKSKGLEYPLVFLPFICGFREVNGRNNHYYRYHDANFNYGIDLSKDDDIRRLSDNERLQEDIRLLYVGITRARFACWLGIAAIRSQNGKNSQLERSGIGHLLGWQTGMTGALLAAQLDQLKGDCASICVMDLPEAGKDSYQPKPASSTPDPVRTSVARIADHWWVASYSSLHTEKMLDMPAADTRLQTTEAENYRDDKLGDEYDPATLSTRIVETGVHGLPRGAEPGVLIHELLEESAQLGFDVVRAEPTLARQLIEKIFNQAQWKPHHSVLQTCLQQWLQLPLLQDAILNLAMLPKHGYQAEAEFLLGVNELDVLIMDDLIKSHTFAAKPRPCLSPNQLHGLLKGFMDLIFAANGRYYVLDYKFNWLGSNDLAYTPSTLEAAMLNKRYDLQAVLYLLALHRLLKVRLGDDYDYDQHIGGGIYLFLRGLHTPDAGRVLIKPARTLIESLDALFEGACA